MGALSINNARYFNRPLLLSVLLIAVSSFNYGFDNQAFATTQAMEPFQRHFGEYNAATGVYNLPTDWLALFNSLNYVGFAAGVLIGGWVCDHFGRRWCMFSMSVYALVTATIAVTSNKREQIMAARVLNYVYVGMELSVVPLFQSEIVPAPVRGLVVGTYQWSLILGGVVINAICYGTSHLDDNRAWRIPIGFFYLVPAVVASCIFLIPESPRWLLRRGRTDEARAALRRLREGAFADDDIDAEFRELQFALDNESDRGSFGEVVRGVNLRRTLIVVGVNFFQQATGQAFSSQYGGVYVRSLRVMNPILFTLMTSCFTASVMVVTLLLNDRTGRRVMLMISSACMGAVLIAMGGLGVREPVPVTLRRATVGMMALFGPGFALGWGPLCYVVATEVTSMRLRDKTSRIGFFVNVLFNFVVNYSIPYLVFPDRAGLGSKVGFLFGGISALSLAFVYFCVPECRGKTLEQVDWLFGSGVRMRDFGSTDTSGMLAEAGRKVDEQRGVEESVGNGDMEKGADARARVEAAK